MIDEELESELSGVAADCLAVGSVHGVVAGRQHDHRERAVTVVDHVQVLAERSLDTGDACAGFGVGEGGLDDDVLGEVDQALLAPRPNRGATVDDAVDFDAEAGAAEVVVDEAELVVETFVHRGRSGGRAADSEHCGHGRDRWDDPN